MSTEYTKTTWQTGDIITADKMNNIENGIKGIEGDITTLSGMGSEIDELGEELTDIKDGLTAVESDVTDLKEDLTQLDDEVFPVKKINDFVLAKYYGNSGFSTGNYARGSTRNIVNTGGKSFRVETDTVFDTTYYFNVIKYVSDTSGTTLVAWRTGSISLNETFQPCYINIMRQDGRDMNQSEFDGILDHIYVTWGVDSYLWSEITRLSNISGLSTQKIVFIGDSIFGLERGDTSIPALCSDFTGATTYQCAMGGTEGGSHGSGSFQYYDFNAIADAIATGDFTDQDAHLNDTGIPSYFANSIATLKALDFSKVNVIVISYGGNDWVNSDSTVTEFITAMETNINKILTAFPNIRFLCMNPPYKVSYSSGAIAWNGDTHQNSNNETLKQFAESYATISADIHVPYINAYNEMGINSNNITQWTISGDGSHPKEAGRRETAKLVSEYLKRYLYN